MFDLNIENNLKLKLVHPSFAPRYLELVTRHQEALAEWLVWPPSAVDEAFFLAFVTRSLHEYADGITVPCAMFYQGALVGNAALTRIQPELKKAEIGYWLAPDYQGKGIVTRSVKALMRHAFDDLGMDVVHICAAEQNTRSRAVAERLGMTLEGVISNRENIRGRIVNHAVYAMRKADFSV